MQTVIQAESSIVVVSPSVQRFDATTHYWQAEFAAVVAFLRARFPSAQVAAEPAGLVGARLRTVVRHLLTRPDFLILWVRVWESPAALEVARLARVISPRTRVLVWGDGPRERLVTQRRVAAAVPDVADVCPPRGRRPPAPLTDRMTFRTSPWAVEQKRGST